MIAIDTNIMVRFLTNDDAAQYKKAYILFNELDVFIADTVILETEWVLRFAYDFKTNLIASALTKLFGLPNVHINHASLVAQAITGHTQGLDFADAFHLANSQQCKTFFTFDKKMIKAAKNIEGCKVLAPNGSPAPPVFSKLTKTQSVGRNSEAYPVECTTSMLRDKAAIMRPNECGLRVNVKITGWPESSK